MLQIGKKFFFLNTRYCKCACYITSRILVARYSYDTETGKVGIGVENIDSEYDGVALINNGEKSMP